uniref:DZF domain-containing protein n=1 Tax=Macrostomum lignano TaxID=282301 RepID=A0A1I8JR58_9PLAT
MEAANRRRREEEQRLRHMAGAGVVEFHRMQARRDVGRRNRASLVAQRPSDDRQVLAKHSSVYPTEAELQAVQQLVTRWASGSQTGQRSPVLGVGCSAATARCNASWSAWLRACCCTATWPPQLVLLCATWPTRELRNRVVVQLLPERLATAPDGLAESSTRTSRGRILRNFRFALTRMKTAFQCISWAAEEDGGLELTCSIYLTSPALYARGGWPDSTEPEDDQLDRDKCLEALAALRQAKWFQAKASSLQSWRSCHFGLCGTLCQRLPVWAPLPNWSRWLLVERCIQQVPEAQLVSPERRPFAGSWSVWPAASCWPAGPGLRDPCEKLPERREDVTASAQQALRLIAFRQRAPRPRHAAPGGSRQRCPPRSAPAVSRSVERPLAPKQAGGGVPAGVRKLRLHITDKRISPQLAVLAGVQNRHLQDCHSPHFRTETLAEPAVGRGGRS